jgi:hypothetical protein
MRDSGAFTELLLTRLKKLEVPKIYVSLRKRLMEHKPAAHGSESELLGQAAGWAGITVHIMRASAPLPLGRIKQVVLQQVV